MTGGRRQKTGTILEESGLIHSSDIDRVLTIQADLKNATGRRKNRLFGAILCDLNLLTPVENYRVLKKNKKLITLQDRLVSQNLMAARQVSQLQLRSTETGIPFLSLALEENRVPKPILAQLLLDLFHVPLRSISDIVFSDKKCEMLSGIIPKSAADRFQAIPLILKESTLLCGITDPDALIFIAELDQKFPQYRFSPVFITFPGFSWFYKMLYKKSYDPRNSEKFSGGPPFLTNFRVTIMDPVQEKEKIRKLYTVYEQARQHMGHTIQQERDSAFLQFIYKHHETIIKKYRCRAVEFFIEKQGARVMISAIPRKQGN